MIIRLLVGIFIYSFSILSLALDADKLATQLFPDVQEEVFRQTRQGEYRIYLDSVKKIDGDWRAEREIKTQSRVVRRIFQLEPNDFLSEAKHSLSENIANLKADLIFACDGLACGSSIVWATKKLDAPQLFGLDASQMYRVLRLKNGEAEFIVAVYLTQQGNRRIFALVDIIQPSKPIQVETITPEKVNNRLKEAGGYTFSSLSWTDKAVSINPTELKAVTIAMRTQPHKKFEVVGHLPAHASETLDENSILLHTTIVNAVEQKLIQSGVRAPQVSSRLNPVANVGDVKVEGFHVELKFRR